MRHAFPGEAQVVGVDVSRRDESARLPGTTAGIGGVYEPALVLHEVPQVAAGSSESLPEVVPTQLQQLCADGVADAENAAEDEDQPLPPVQTQQHARRAADSRLLDEEPYIGGHRPRVRQFRVRRVVEGPSILRERDLPGLGAPAFHVQEVVDDDSVEPRAQAAASVERRESREQLDQDLLRGVFSVLRVVHHSEREVVDPRLMTHNQFLEGSPTASLRPLNQLLVSPFTCSDVRKRIGISCHNLLDTG